MAKRTEQELEGRQLQERYEWIVYLRNKGYSFSEIGQLLHLTKQRVEKICSDGPVASWSKQKPVNH